MLVFRYNSALQTHLDQLRIEGQVLGFVPTMGALHAGHISLLKAAQNQADTVVVSVYVNPTQFNDASDFDKYPRQYDRDLALLAAQGCDIVWLPNDAEMYPQGKTVSTVDYGALTGTIEGHFRPGHFDGMVDIVRKLLNTVKPHKACFGQKDFQQLAIIRHLVKTEEMEVEIMGCPIKREESGLAMSSRNARLSQEHRAAAAFIKQTLDEAAQLRATKNPQELERWAEQIFAENIYFDLEYFFVVNASSFERVETWQGQSDFRMLVAAYIGGIRLIDNAAV